MRIHLWCLVLLLACLCTPGHCDCQGDCVACALLLQQQLHRALNTEECVLECEGRVTPSLMWEVCKRAVKLPRQESLPDDDAVPHRRGGQLELTPTDLNSDSSLLQLAKSFLEPYFAAQRGVRYDSDLLGSKEEEEEEREGGESLTRLEDDEEMERDEKDAMRQADEEEEDDDGERSEGDSSEALSLSKRFGGFQRGRHAYRKLMGSRPRPLQKRYGGFIGTRKSARKWKSRKRINQFLRQYLEKKRAGASPP